MHVTSQKHFTNKTEICGPVPASPNNQSHLRKLDSGRPIFFEGDIAKNLYRVIEGVVCTYKLTINGHRQVLSFGYPGDIIGLNSDGQYHNDCDAISDVVLQPLVQQDDVEFTNSLLKYTTAEIANMQEHFLILGRKSAVEKVASFLNILKNRIGEKNSCAICFSLPMGRADIADFLGLSIETVSRCFTELRKKKIIYLPNPHQVCVGNCAALQELAESND